MLTIIIASGAPKRQAHFGIFHTQNRGEKSPESRGFFPAIGGIFPCDRGDFTRRSGEFFPAIGGINLTLFPAGQSGASAPRNSELKTIYRVGTFVV